MLLSTGEKFRVSIFGSSHGEFVGAYIDGCPKGVVIDETFLQRQIDRRKPKNYGTTRQEDDEVIFIEGLNNQATTGDRVTFKIANNNVNKADYDSFHNWFRPSHVDYPYYVKNKEDSLKYKDISSARMFLPIVVAGCFAQWILKQNNIFVRAEVVQIGGLDYLHNQLEVKNLLNIVNAKGDTVAGKIRCTISGMQAGIGEPIFGKVSSMLAKNMMSIPSCYSFCLAREDRDVLLGSEDIDRWNSDFSTKTNNCGGLNGGMTNGNDIVFLTGFHAIHTLKQVVECINPDGQLQTMQIKGRHDVCQVFRAEVIVEAMAALTIVEYIL